MCIAVRKIRAAVWQCESVPGDVEKNLAALAAVLARRNLRGVDLLVAPEMFATGWLPELLRDRTPTHERVENEVSHLAQEHGIAIACSVHVRRNARDYNTFHLWGSDGRLLGSQDKIHLWDRESQTITAGSEPNVIETPLGRMGGMVCYDVEFPEVARTLALQDAELFLVPSAFYTPQSWDIMTRARALENGCFLLGANQVGGDPNKPHNGQSRIVDPYGGVLAEVRGKRAGVVAAELDPAVLTKARSWAPFLRDRRTPFPRATAVRAMNSKA